MRILITGGAGFIGCNAADAFLAEGHAVTVLDDLSRSGSESNLDWLRSRHPGLVFVNAGYGQPELRAVRPDGSGDLTDGGVAWKLTRGVPGLASPVLVGDYLYLANEKGIATCVEAATGQVVWQERLGGSFSASPVAAAGRVYWTAEDGRTTVLRSGPTFEVLAVNRLDGTIKASPAVVGKTLILRTDSHLYRIEE